MPGTTLTALPSFSHDQHHKTDAAKRKGVGGIVFIAHQRAMHAERDTVLPVLSVCLSVCPSVCLLPNAGTV